MKCIEEQSNTVLTFCIISKYNSSVSLYKSYFLLGNFFLEQSSLLEQKKNCRR